MEQVCCIPQAAQIGPIAQRLSHLFWWGGGSCYSWYGEWYSLWNDLLAEHSDRSREVLTVPGLMTWKAWSAQSSIGSLQKVKHSIRIFHKMQSLVKAFTMNALAHYFVQLVMIGLIPSMFSIQPKLNNPLIIWFMAGSKRSCTQDSFVSQAINDPSSCMWTIHMIPKILEMAYCTAGYWYWQISFSYARLWTYWQILLTQAYKHIFTSPSSVDVEEPRAMHSCNTCIHRMYSVTKAAITYVATQVSFSFWLCCDL